MSGDPIILSEAERRESLDYVAPDNNQPKKKRWLKLALLIGLLIIIIVGLFFIWQWKNGRPGNGENKPSQGESSQTDLLPTLSFPESGTTNTASSSFFSLAIEYLAFSDFYTAPDNKIEPKINDYQLPLNVKIDVMNHYDISRKVNLDSGLNNLNQAGFAIVDNPWAKEAGDFYGLYGQLASKQVPLLITADFIIYYQQNILKRAFKDIEENVFYDNLWEINKEMYTAARNRYEARLAQIGDINDSLLEGERLETAFFAVALELMKPLESQIIAQGGLDDKTKFVAAEAERFNLILPSYLKDDVLAEVKLIREARKEKTKSPVFLYNRNYPDFAVPSDYSSDAKLNNFYLTTKWLNSVWPVNYQSKDCSDCLLDREDWRISMIAASFISQDFSSLPGLKNKWARIYKVISFFKGLREDLNYVYYRDSLSAVFGPNYKIEELFVDSNKDASNNLEKLRSKLLSYDFPAVAGALAKSDPALRSHLGFKMLVESYWPNEYLTSRLITPAVDSYLGTSTAANNITACIVNKINRRCNGIALDFVALMFPISHHNYFNENTNYINYEQELSKLQAELNQSQVWHTNGYWTILNWLEAYLTMTKDNLPLFARSDSWRDRSLNMAVGAWINFQLPLEKFTINQSSSGGQGLNNFSRWSENSYVEPNLNLINELLATNEMVLRMLAALQLDREVPSASQEIRNASNNLQTLKKIVIKELTGEKLSQTDNEAIVDFSKQLKVEPANPKDKQMTLKLPQQKTSLKEDLSRLKLLVLVHQEGEARVFSVGPIWDYQEKR